MPSATDLCNGTNVLIRPFSTDTNTVDGCLYTIARVWEIFDACSNRTTCTQIVTRVDNTPPVLTCAPSKTCTVGKHMEFRPARRHGYLHGSASC